MLHAFTAAHLQGKGHEKRERELTVQQAPEIQNMYTLSMPVSQLRTKMRQEFERHRYVNQIKTVDVLLFNSHQEFQVWRPAPVPKWPPERGIDAGTGNAQLLEAIVARAQVLPHRGGAQRAVAEQLHQWVLGGMSRASDAVCEAVWKKHADCDRAATLEVERQRGLQRRVYNRQYHSLSVLQTPTTALDIVKRRAMHTCSDRGPTPLIFWSCAL